MGRSTTTTTTNADGTTTTTTKADVYVTVPNGNGTIREMVKNYIDTPVESGCELQYVPKHVAVIMDGNRRYGKRIYGQGNMGHFDGGQKLLQVIEWLDTEGVKALTIYAFSTENWNRESTEVDTLMGLFQQFVEDDLRPIVFNRKVQLRHICTDSSNMPPKLHAAINALEEQSMLHATADSMTLNVCLSYGSRGEILNACRSIARECVAGTLHPDTLTEDAISERLLTAHNPDPDVLIRTSGEERISNFLLWQLSYTELFFLEKDWPELDKEDFLKVIRTFAKGRQRRFGK
jgi:undecaprenyl diphosphate synthase